MARLSKSKAFAIYEDTVIQDAGDVIPEHENAVSFSVYDTQQDSDASVTLDRETALALARYIIDSVG